MDEKKKTPMPFIMTDESRGDFNDYLYYSDPARFENFNEAEDAKRNTIIF